MAVLARSCPATCAADSLWTAPLPSCPVLTNPTPALRSPTSLLPLPSLSAQVRRLEEALKTGHLPSEITVGGEANGAAAMDEG